MTFGLSNINPKYENSAVLYTEELMFYLPVAK